MCLTSRKLLSIYAGLVIQDLRKAFAVIHAASRLASPSGNQVIHKGNALRELLLSVAQMSHGLTARDAPFANHRCIEV